MTERNTTTHSFFLKNIKMNVISEKERFEPITVTFKEPDVLKNLIQITREQIIYQIENLNNNSDKKKINEWILIYNDFVNDANTNIEKINCMTLYHDLDMRNHTIIKLV